MAQIAPLSLGMETIPAAVATAMKAKACSF